ncbi:MAG: hypothetical protein NTX81_02220 [Candidatus Bathyarchaeota archaeon]|nr:hypothetical protein [Candidatus Bathyarchaeota archaeon]
MTLVNNREAYDHLSNSDKKELISCYYHIVEDQTYTAYQYWYYYAYNDYSGAWTSFLPDRHDHDVELAIVYVNKSTGRPVAMSLNQHHWRNWVWNPNPHMSVFGEEGGHGMFRQKRIQNKWEDGGLEIKVEPRETVEFLREHFVNPEPANLIEDDGTIKGKTANFIGMWAKPKVPWVRLREYALPISKLLSEAEEEKKRLLQYAPKTYPYMAVGEFTLSLPYDKLTRQENLDEALRIGLITKDQHTALTQTQR